MKMHIPDEVIDWLLEDHVWLQYRTRLDLLNKSEDDKEVVDIKESLLDDPQICELVNMFQKWPGDALRRHNDAKHLIHKLVFVADLGLTKDTLSINNVAKEILNQQSEEGQFQTLLHIHERYGGSGRDELNWMLCDSPLLLYFLIKVGYGDNEQIKRASIHLKSLIRENGWPCASSNTFKGFRGPGRKADPCPYATLISLRALAQLNDKKDENVLKQGTESLLNLWENRKTKKAYLFGMGTDFKKLKAPLIWYDLLHVSEVLSQFEWVHKDSRFQEMIELLKSKIDDEGKCSAESVWRAWKDWDFGQKREPSKWITFLVYRILKRINSQKGK
jgi:hypothetical protein